MKKYPKVVFVTDPPKKEKAVETININAIVDIPAIHEHNRFLFQSMYRDTPYPVDSRSVPKELASLCHMKTGNIDITTIDLCDSYDWHLVRDEVFNSVMLIPTKKEG